MKNLKQSKLPAIALTVTLMIFTGFFGCVNSGEKEAGNQSEMGITDAKPPKLDIHAAALMGDVDAIRQHIKAGTDLEQKDPMGGSTPLITACVFGKTEVARALIEAGADLNAKNNDGSTPLHCAALFGYPDIVSHLLAHGADKMQTNNAGEFPIRAVEVSFDKMVPIYDFFSEQLGPLGLKLDYDDLKVKRPQIAEMLK